MSMSIARRIVIGFGGVLFFLIGVGAVSFSSMLKLAETTEWVTHTHKVLETAEGVLSELSEAETGGRGFLITGDEAYLEPYQRINESLPPKLRQLRELTRDNGAQQARLDRLEPLIEQRRAILADTIRLRREKGFEPVPAALRSNGGKRTMEQVRGVLADVEGEELQLLKRRSDEAAATMSQAKSVIVGGSLAALVLVVVAGLWIYRSVVGPLAVFAGVIERVGGGDLTQKFDGGDDEIGRLGGNLNRMVEGLSTLAGQTRSGTDDLTTAAAEILASAQEQVASSGEQAAAVQETSATVEEISQSGAQIADKARRIAGTAEAVTGVSNAGREAVQSTSRTMEAIREQAEAVAENIVSLSEKTQAVGEIIATVNGVAEQSHLLALNAAIEAAGAGEHGHRFSVVASEMKHLAGQAREATVQVRSILGDIQKGINSSVMLTEEAVKRVESGKQQAEVGERTIRQMAGSIQESVQAFQQIVAATNQQQIGLEQVSLAMKNIRQAYEQSTVGTRQLEKAVASLNGLGQQLRKSVERYRV